MRYGSFLLETIFFNLSWPRRFGVIFMKLIAMPAKSWRREQGTQFGERKGADNGCK